MKEIEFNLVEEPWIRILYFDNSIEEVSWHQFYKGGDSRRRVSLLAVTFEGKLVVTDAAMFRETLVQGIGRGKAYGMGMMTVIRGT
jgi:CRISPR system Cascade subunit CasE